MPQREAVRLILKPLLAALAAAAALAATLAPATAADEDPLVTYYLHAPTPVGKAHDVLEYGAGLVGPTMDEVAPSGVAPKTSQAAMGNAEFRRNFLNSYWAGEVHGRVHGLVAELWLQSSANATVSVRVFGDGGTGVFPAFAKESVDVPAGGPTLVRVDFGDAEGMVDQQMVLSVAAGATGVTTLFDSTLFPSSLSFRLGPYVAPPPPGGEDLPLPAAGWDAPRVMAADRAQRETSLAVDPTDADVMLACTPSGVPAINAGHSYFYRSTDGGATWSYLEVEPSDTDGRRAAFEGGDCDVAFDAAGTMYVADTWLGSLSVGASRDGGATWSGTPLAASGAVVDRPWLVGGPAGVVHVTYQDVQFAMPTVIWYTRSTDYGQTFQAAIPLAVADEDGAFSWQGNLVVAPDQKHLYSIHTKRMLANRGLEANGAEDVVVMTSADGGVTWSKHLVAKMPFPASFLYPALAMDGGGVLHAVWAGRPADGADHPVWHSYSLDGAQTWSAPVKLLAGVAAYAPWVEGGASAGEAVFQWLGSPAWRTNVTSTSADWYLYAGRVTGAGTPAMSVTAGPTTQEPLFTGEHRETPEFNQVRLGPDGKMRVGASVYASLEGGGSAWRMYYQEES